MDHPTFDQQYVRKLSEGDSETEQHFTKFFGELLLVKLRSRLRSPQAVDDVRQETFLRVLSALRREGGVQHPERFGAFVNSVCNNVLLEFFRAGARAGTMPEDSIDPPEPSANAESKLVTEERKGRVHAVLSQMPSKDQELLRLIFFEERDKDEICREMAIDRNYLRVLLHRAKLRFRDSLGKGHAGMAGIVFLIT